MKSYAHLWKVEFILFSYNTLIFAKGLYSA